MAFERFPMRKGSRGKSWAELMDGAPSKPNGNDAPDQPDQTVRDETHPGGRFAGQRVTPQSPSEALQPAAAPQATRAFGVQWIPHVSVDRGDRLHVRARLEPPPDA